MMEIETHPFHPFVPKNASILILGSFPGKEQTQSLQNDDQWFYGAKRNQFWKIISAVYQIDLIHKFEKQELFEKLGIGLADILLKIRRKENSNLDKNLEIVEYNTEAIKKVLANSDIKTILFTSKFVKAHFRKLFPEIHFTGCLPSPSPRFARMPFKEKVDQYKILMPNLSLIGNISKNDKSWNGQG